MRFFEIIACMSIFLSGLSCITEEIKEKPSEKTENVQGQSWAIDKLPTLENRQDFDDYITRLKFGNEKERKQVFIGFQLKIDMCLPFIIEELENEDKFKGADFPIVSSKGNILTNVIIPSNTYTIGSALERFLVSYFYKDPARTSFNVTRRDNAVEVWKNWYSRRRAAFRWNSWGIYSNK